VRECSTGSRLSLDEAFALLLDLPERFAAGMIPRAAFEAWLPPN
jgi:hypothetical protein